jgi:hypothetical protein
MSESEKRMEEAVKQRTWRDWLAVVRKYGALPHPYGLIIAGLEAEIGLPPPGSHPDEAKPRGETWHAERVNWQGEVERLRALTPPPSPPAERPGAGCAVCGASVAHGVGAELCDEHFREWMHSEEAGTTSPATTSEIKKRWAAARRKQPVPPPARGEEGHRIYLASSWRNKRQPEVLAALRKAGHEVYDFRNPKPGTIGFSWKQCTKTPPPWSAVETIGVLAGEVAQAGLKLDFDAMKWADTVVMLQPCGRSAALELGLAIGAGKHTLVLLDDGQEPELMIRLADHLAVNLDELLTMIRELPPSPPAERPGAGETWREADGTPKA